MTATEILAQLNSYDGDNLWEDVVRALPNYDDAATEAADPDCHSDIIVLTDGTALYYEQGRWN
jgi:hypothetical protein